MTDQRFLDVTELQMKDFSAKLDELYESKKKGRENLSRLLRLLQGQELFIGRLKSLLDNYKQDLKRLEFVNSGFTLMAALGNEKCPLCGSDIAMENLMASNTAAYKVALQKEYSSTYFKIVDVEKLISSKELDSKRTANKIGELNIEITKINNEIEAVKPNLAQLKQIFSVAQINIEKNTKHNELENFIKEKDKDLLTIESLLKRINKKNENEEYSKDYVTTEFLDVVKQTLNSWKYDSKGIDEVAFDEKDFDITIDGRKRTSYGKGNRSVSTAAVMISLFDYFHEKNRCFSDILILDSPLCTKYDNEKDGWFVQDSRTPIGVIDSFAQYCNDKDWKYQIIIIDNKFTSDLDVKSLNKINVIEFGTDDRSGLF